LAGNLNDEPRAAADKNTQPLSLCSQSHHKIKSSLEAVTFTRGNPEPDPVHSDEFDTTKQEHSPYPVHSPSSGESRNIMVSGVDDDSLRVSSRKPTVFYPTPVTLHMTQWVRRCRNQKTARSLVFAVFPVSAQNKPPNWSLKSEGKRKTMHVLIVF